MRTLAAVSRSQSTFREEKHLAQLTAPVIDSGTLLYVRPDHLEKHTTAPQDERLVVDGARLSIARGGQAPRILDLDDQPEIAALVDTVRGTLAGDLAVLLRHYSVGLEGSEAAWRLTLVPIEPRLARLLRLVRIDGHGSSLDVIQTEQADGASTRMTIAPLPPPRP